MDPGVGVSDASVGTGVGATIAIEGKALRGIHGGELPGVRLVAAYAGESGLVLGQKGGSGANARRVNWGWPPACWPVGTQGQGGYRGRPLRPAGVEPQRPGTGRGLLLGAEGPSAWKPGVKEAVRLLFDQPPWGESFAGVCQEGRHGDR